MTGANPRAGIAAPVGSVPEGLAPVGLETGHGQIRALVGGDGPPIVLLHGLAASGSTWAEVVSSLLSSGRRVASLDLPGHGGSARPPRGASLDWFAGAVAEAIRELGAAPALVAGHSLGGDVALRLAVRHAGVVRGLVLIAPSSGRMRRRTRALAGLTTVRVPDVAARLGSRLAERAWFRQAVYRPFLVTDVRSASARALRGLVASVAEHRDPRAALRAVMRESAPVTESSCPTLVLWGARDRVLPPGDGLELARALDVPLRVVAGCGHLLPIERPEAVLDALAWLEARV
jgi:pimeloyl-ACP methyl ester carboxylesterase